MRVIILGGDGFCGWPTALHMSASGHEVHVIDSLVRRKIDAELGIESLTPIASPDERLRAWNEASGRAITFKEMDIATAADELEAELLAYRPDAVVHFAEQRAAPYSMRSPTHKRYTVDNNVRGTHNLLSAVVSTGLDIHVVHLGTMGVYGYGSGLPVPEGYLNVAVDVEGSSVSRQILFPVDPGSVYHMTKCLDQLMFAFYNKNDGVRVTDLHQGIVWGTQTQETAMHPSLINRFDYDGEFGTVLNRFLVQAAVSHPLTVHGTGQQTRAFIHIQDTVKCVRLAVENPPDPGGRVRIVNQATETHRLLDLAKRIAALTGATISFVPSPRVEPEANELQVDNSTLLRLGLQPTFLDDGLAMDVTMVAAMYKSRVAAEHIPARTQWRPHLAEAAQPGSTN